MKSFSLVSSSRLFSAVVILVAATCFAPSLRAQDGPTPYPDPANSSAWPGAGTITVLPWMKDNRTFFWSQRADKQGAVVLVGDSFLGNWVYSTVKIDTAFPHIKSVANRGIGGDVSRGVLFRFQEDVLDLKPEAVVIDIGSNDLSAKGDTSDIVANISQMLDMAQKQNPNMPIILCTLAPRDSKTAPIDPGEVPKLNAAIKQLAEGKSYVTVFDIHALFENPDGTPNPIYYKEDLLHPSDAGYAKLAEGLGQTFDKLNLK